MSYETKSYPCLDTAALHKKIAELEEKVDDNNDEQEDGK